MVSDHHYVQTYEEAAAASIKAGTDINSGNIYLLHLENALQQKLITEQDIDNALYNAFKIRFQLGLFDPIDDQPYWHVPPTAVDTAQSQALNLLATKQSIVLLKNDANTLPFSKGKNIAVLGPHGNATSALVGNYIGQICPSGKYDCVTSPYQAIKTDNVGGNTVYSEGCQINSTSTAGFAAAVTAAKAADYVILFLGIDQTIEREGHDRIEITLPGVQERFAQTILAVGKPTVIVLINGGIVAIDNLKPITPAIIEAFYPGYWGGVALANVLFGDYNPGGKLPVTYYASNFVTQSNFLDMSMTDAPGRTYRYFKGTPLWPFGWGLSYTNFNLNWTKSQPSETVLSNQFIDAVTYEVNVTNIGKRAGDEVVLAFYVPPSGPLLQQLFGFQRVNLEPNESKVISFTMNYETVKQSDTYGNIISVPGTFKVVFTNGVDQNLDTSLVISGTPRMIETYPFKE
jgi:hypothetical protein